MIIALPLLLSSPAIAEPPVKEVAPESLEVRRRVAPVFPKEGLGLAGIRCVARVTIDERGKPEAVEADESCPPQLVRPTEVALLKWRWHPPGARVQTSIGVSYKTHGGPNDASSEAFSKVAEAYVEAPDERSTCAVGMTLHASGSIADLTSNRCPGASPSLPATPRRGGTSWPPPPRRSPARCGRA